MWLPFIFVSCCTRSNLVLSAKFATLLMALGSMCRPCVDKCREEIQVDDEWGMVKCVLYVA